MTQPFLYMRHRGAAFTQNAVFKEVNRQLVQIGSDFGSKTPTTAVQMNVAVHNKVVNWEDDIYAVDLSGVWKYDVSAGSWGLEHTFASRNTDVDAESIRMPLTAASLNGEPRLCTAYPTAATTYRLVTITPTGSFESPDIPASPSLNYNSANTIDWQSPVSYRNTITYANVRCVVELSLEDYSTSIANFNANEPEGMDLCVFRDKVFIARSIGAQQTLYRKDGTTLTFITFMDSGQGFPGLSNTVTPCIFPVGNKIWYFFYKDGNAGGTEGYEVGAVEFPPGQTSNPYVHALSSAKLPSALRNRTTTQRNSRITSRIDLLTNGPQSPSYQIEYHQDTLGGEGTSVDLYSFVPDSGTVMSLIDSGMDGFNFSTCVVGGNTGGLNIWPGSGTINCSPPKLSVVGPVVRAVFDIFGPAATSGIALEVIYDKNGQIPTTQATIEATNMGSLSGNIITGLATGDKVVASWSAALDGIGIVDNPRIAGRVFIP